MNPTTLIIYLVAGISASFAIGAVAVVWCICAMSARRAQREEDNLGIRRS